MKLEILKQVKVKDVAQVIDALLCSEKKRVTKFVAPNITVKATRLHKPDRRDRAETYVVSIGRPNYQEREFIKDCKKAGEPFPVRNLIFQDFPVKRG